MDRRGGSIIIRRSQLANMFPRPKWHIVNWIPHFLHRTRCLVITQFVPTARTKERHLKIGLLRACRRPVGFGARSLAMTSRALASATILWRQTIIGRAMSTEDRIYWTVVAFAAVVGAAIAVVLLWPHPKPVVETAKPGSSPVGRLDHSRAHGHAAGSHNHPMWCPKGRRSSASYVTVQPKIKVAGGTQGVPPTKQTSLSLMTSKVLRVYRLTLNRLITQ